MGGPGPPGPPGPQGPAGPKRDDAPPSPDYGPSPSRTRRPKPDAPMDYGGDDRRPPGDPPPSAKIRAMANPDAQGYAMSLQLQAELQGIREEIARQTKQQAIQQEIANRHMAAQQTPHKEIIRELQTIVQPGIPIPAPPPDHSALQSLLEKAVTMQKAGRDNPPKMR